MNEALVVTMRQELRHALLNVRCLQSNARSYSLDQVDEETLSDTASLLLHLLAELEELEL